MRLFYSFYYEKKWLNIIMFLLKNIFDLEFNKCILNVVLNTFIVAFFVFITDLHLLSPALILVYNLV